MNVEITHHAQQLLPHLPFGPEATTTHYSRNEVLARLLKLLYVWRLAQDPLDCDMGVVQNGN